jgi:D-sedoheptulose 7-phosphate isomerase
MSFSESYKQQTIEALSSIDLAKVDKAIEWLREARDCGRHIFVCGNGGSASTASHFVCDVVKGASYERPSRFRILALTDSMATLTAYSNDVGYQCVFVEQLRNFAAAGDLVMAISGSGNSPNVVEAVEYANRIGCKTIGLTGRSGGKLGQAAQLQIHVPLEHMGRIEDAHMVICHMIAYYFMETESHLTAERPQPCASAG